MLRDLRRTCSPGLRWGVQPAVRCGARQPDLILAPADCSSPAGTRRGLSSRVLASALFSARADVCLPATIGALPAVHLKSLSCREHLSHRGIVKWHISHGRCE